MRISTIFFFLYNLIIFYQLIPVYTSVCKDGLTKYQWTQDRIDDQVAYFIDSSIRSQCHINYDSQLDIFYVIDNTYVVRMNQFAIRILISFSVTLFFGIMNQV
jgi:hypothetical protein